MTEAHEFHVVLRGYDRPQVDALLQRAGEAVQSTDPALRASVAARLRDPKLSVVLRGYDRLEVDGVLERLSAVLGTVH
jgi:DivIVA domain-containing protein